MVPRGNAPGSGPPPTMDRQLADPYPRCCLAVPAVPSGAQLPTVHAVLASFPSLSDLFTSLPVLPGFTSPINYVYSNLGLGSAAGELKLRH